MANWQMLRLYDDFCALNRGQFTSSSSSDTLKLVVVPVSHMIGGIMPSLSGISIITRELLTRPWITTFIIAYLRGCKTWQRSLSSSITVRHDTSSPQPESFLESLKLLYGMKL